MNPLNNQYDFYIGDDEIIKLSTTPKAIVSTLNKIKNTIIGASLFLAFLYLISLLNNQDLNEKEILYVLGFITAIWLAHLVYNYLRLRNTTYFITNRRIIIYSHFINKNVHFTYLNAITEVTVGSSFIDKLFTTASIKVLTVEEAGSRESLGKEYEKINAVAKPKEIIRAIEDMKKVADAPVE